MSEVELIATSAFGLEAVVARELKAIGYEGRTIQPGRILFRSTPEAICRSNLMLRCAERVLICLGRFEARDFGELFDRTQALDWQEWIPADGQFPVRGKSLKSQLSSVPACQRIVKKAIVDKLKTAHQVDTLHESGAQFSIEIALLDDMATLSLDTTGVGLHKRGYRSATGPAPLRETLAAALVYLSFWNPQRPLIDPFCGTGTIPIEAALIGRNIAPGAQRSFVAEMWPSLDERLWRQARQEVQHLAKPELSERIIGTDTNARDLRLAREHAEAAGVAADIHFQQRAFADLSSQRRFGCLICNPPYGHRLGEKSEIAAIYRSFPYVLRRLPTWSHFVLTAYPDFESVVGQRADRRRKLYNGQIECQYYQFQGPKPEGNKDAGGSGRQAHWPPMNNKSSAAWTLRRGGRQTNSAIGLPNGRGISVAGRSVESLAIASTSSMCPVFRWSWTATKTTCTWRSSHARTTARLPSMPIGSISWSAQPAK